MAYDTLILLAPCHGLEDFPLYHTGEDAASLLACWTSLWHPLFLNTAKHLPHVERCDYPPEDLANALLVLPTPCESEMDSDLPEVAEDNNAKLIRGLHQRAKILELALEPYGEEAVKLDGDLVRDFLAFGFAFLQVEVLTQQMRYSSSIDQTRIARVIKEAAAAVIEGNADLCREKLTVCHDALEDERSHYYPVDVYLIDLTLLATADATLGTALDRQLRDGISRNFLASGETIEKLATTNTSALQSIRNGLEEGTIGLVGGEYQELELPLMSFESATRQLQRGARTYEEHLGQRPSCFGRRRNGLYPSLSQVIRHAGYQSALHFRYDEGQTPESSQGKTKWAMGQRELLECYARSPLDASAHETFLNLPSQLSDTMDTDHVAARVFIHWPGQATTWYDDLRRCARYGSALGKFVTVNEFFQDSTSSSTDSFVADDYAYPFLKQAVVRGDKDPISKWVRYWNQSIEIVARHGYEVIASCLGATDSAANVSELSDQIDDHLNGGSPDQLDADTNKVIDSIGESLCSADSKSRTIVNPFSFARRMLVRSNATGPGTGSSVYAAGLQDNGSQAMLVDVPAMGFACVKFDAGNSPADAPNLAEDLTLSNEFFQATIDHETGALRALKDYKSRKTRLSQQLAFRITLPKTGQHWVDRQAPVTYSVMASDSVEITQNGRVFAELTATGRMLALNGELVGEFVQRYQIMRGSRVLTVDIEVTPVPEMILEDPWDSYYACRFAFGDETAILRAGSRMQTHDVSRRRFEAPLFVDIDCGAVHTTILTGGLPYHRRASLSQLDTLFSVSGETSKHFRIGIGVDLPSMTRSAIDFIASATDPPVVEGSARTDSGWFYHIDSKSVIAPWWQPLENGEGIRLRLVETENRKSRVRIHSFKSWREGHVVDASGTEIEELTVTDGIVEFTAEPHVFAELCLRW